VQREAPNAHVIAFIPQLSELVRDLIMFEVVLLDALVFMHLRVELIVWIVATFAALLIPVAERQEDLTKFESLTSDVPLSHFGDHGGPLVLEFFDQIFLHQLLLLSYVSIAHRQ